MFRCVTMLRGLVIDIDTFEEPIEQWNFFLENYRCCFLTFKEETKKLLKERRGGVSIVYEPQYAHVFAPGSAIHEKVLTELRLSTSEIAYVSKNIDFIDNAMCFLSGTIWIKEGVLTYQDASRCPDLIFNSLTDLCNGLKNQMSGCFGEVMLSPDISAKRGYSKPVFFEVDNLRVVLFSLGRYFGYSHYMNQLHPYSSAIFWNKKKNSKAYGVFNEQFADFFTRLVRHIKENGGVDCVCHVPVRPGHDNRFKEITETVAREAQVENISEFFVCTRDYETQKGLTELERRENIRGVFEFHGNLSHKNVVLIDDIITTGATVEECIRILKSAGVANVSVIVLAINQIGRPYWSSNQPIVACPKCGKKMHLIVNSNNRSFFYLCYDCKETMGYESGRIQVIDKVNREF